MPARLPPLHDLVAFKAAGLDWDEPTAGTLFEDAMLMYEAAADGQGVALTLKTLFDGYAASGRLVKPFAIAIPDRAYTIVLSPEAAHKPAVPLFTAWLRSQAGAPA